MKRMPEPYAPALKLERMLGDPECGENLLSFRQAMRWDEADAFPAPAVARLHALGLPRVYVPQALGGALSSSETFIALGRVLARRNMSVAVAYSTMLWTTLAWIGGDRAQQRQVADWVLRSGHFPCLAYSEEEHGADLLANQLRAERNSAGQFQVSGEKWPINRATQSEFLVMLARTDAGAHMRNHSLFIFDKARLDAQRYYCLPRARTHGLRGCDISGIGFQDCPLPADALVGQMGHGLELALKGFQVTRTYCTALSLGVGDSALRIVTRFAQGRRLYGGNVDALPHARDVLANAYLSQLMAECVSLVAARGLHLFPGQFSTWSSVAKVQTSHLVDHAMQALAPVLGARYYLRERHCEGMFQKFLRDGAIVSVFDGSSIVCLDALATFLPDLAQGTLTPLTQKDAAALFRLTEPVPGLAFERLSLYGRGRDAVVQSLPLLLRQLADLTADAHLDAAQWTRISEEAARLDRALSALRADIEHAGVARGRRNSAHQFALAEHYCALHSAVACLGLWLHNRDALGPFFARGDWLLAALQRQGQAVFRSGALDVALTDALMQQLQTQSAQAQMYSLLPWPLAQAGAHEDLSCSPLFESQIDHEPIRV